MKADPDLSLWDDALSGAYDQQNYGQGSQGYVMNASHRLIEQAYGPDIQFGQVLEVGAGSGVHLQHVRHGYDRYVMTDGSDAMLQVARARYAGNAKLQTQVEDALHLSFPDASFDRVIATHVLEHIPEPHLALREWVRVARPGGVLSLVLPCDPGLAWRFGRMLGPRAAAEKRGIPYDYVMAREHVNSITNLVALLRYYFDDLPEQWWPLRIPFSDVNLIYGVNIRL